MSGLNLTFIFDRNKRSNSQNKGSVELRITLNRQRRYVGSGVKILPKYWKRGQVVGLPEASEMNMTLNNLARKVLKIGNELEEKGILSIDGIISHLNETRTPKLSFLDYAEERAKVHSLDKAEMTGVRYSLFVKWLKGWGKIVTFEDVNERKIKMMDEELKKKGMKEVSRYANYHKFMKTFIIDAIADGLLKLNPYTKLRIKKGDTNGILRYLTPQEFHKIEEVELPTESLARVRDLFVFQTYTMLSYCDLCEFDYSKCQNLGGAKVYTGYRQKTKVEFTFMLLEKALDVLKKYNYKLPIISNVKYNLYLKAIAQYVGIEKPLSSHYARHTGATLLLNDGNVPIKTIAKILGHSTTRETEKIYAKLLDETIVQQMRYYQENSKTQP